MRVIKGGGDGGCAALTRPTRLGFTFDVGWVSEAHPPFVLAVATVGNGRVGKRSAPTICVLGKYRGKRNISGWGIRSVRHNAAFICAPFSRERAKGAHRRPLCNPGSRQKIAPAGKPRLFPSGHGSGMTIRPCIVMPSHRLLGPSLGLAPSGPTLRVVQKCSRHFCPSGASRPAVKRRGRFF